ncbi:MAG: hypothetical protein R3B74_01305 [Nitrospirales bacterium]|nr:hypothetical protein [Nitrospirales bacterium]
MYLRKPFQLHVFALFSFLICGWTTADHVIDLVFEEQTVTVAHATGEDPDDPAEHLLMQSSQAGSQATATILTTQALDPALFSIAIHLKNHTILGADPPPYPPPRSRPISFSIPLRI